MSIASTCELLGVSRQVYYRSNTSKRANQIRSASVVSLVKEVRRDMPRLGSRKLYHILQKPLQDLCVGRDKLIKILSANHMLIKPKKNYRTTTDSNHRFKKHKNLIQDMELTRPNQLWVSDITYVGGRDRNCYLALVTDAYSKKIVGYDVSNSLAVEGSLRALKQANSERKKDGNQRIETLIHHSDRGLQYCSNSYQAVLAKSNVICSMTETSDPYDNAIAERVNGILKQEFLLEDYNVNIKTMQDIVKDAVRIYNTKRPHWSCHMQTPEQMHNQREIKIKTYKKEKKSENSMASHAVF